MSGNKEKEKQVSLGRVVIDCIYLVILGYPFLNDRSLSIYLFPNGFYLLGGKILEI